MRSTRSCSTRYLIPLVLILLAGAALQFEGLSRMTHMLSYDEAYYGIDALSLLKAPRLEVFFPANYGRESGWMYLLVPWLAVLGVQPFTPRIAAMLVGFLTLAAVYLLGRETIGKRAAIWATAGLAVLYWHVQVSHLALRVNTYPLVGTLAFAILFRAYKDNQLKHWLLAGALFGILVYTYFAARLWIAYSFLVLGWWFLREKEKWRGIILALVLAGILAAPLIGYTAVHPNESLHRISGVAILNPQSLAQSVLRWAEAWLFQGTMNAAQNLPGRPILDMPLAILLLVGIVSLPWIARRTRQAWWVYGLAVLSLTPSVFSEFPPHLLRAIGTTIPIALILGAGAVVTERAAKVAGRYAVAFPLALMVWAGADTYRDIQTWLELPEMFAIMEQHVHNGVDYVLHNVPGGTPVYFSPFTLAHPVISFDREQLSAYPVGAFDGNTCLVVSDVPAVYVSVTPFDPGLYTTLSTWADTQILLEDQAAATPRYTIYRTAANPSLLSGWEGPSSAVFGGMLQLRLLAPLPESAHRGETLTIPLAVRRLHPIAQPYHIFIHLYGDPTPYEGGPLWSQTDNELCDSYPPTNWTANEIIVQTFTLPISAETEPGEYVIAVGLYDFSTGERLRLDLPGGQADYFELHRIQVAQ